MIIDVGGLPTPVIKLNTGSNEAIKVTGTFVNGTNVLMLILANAVVVLLLTIK
jgi:hypothetical protein